MAEEDNNDDKEEDAAEDGVVIEGYNPPKPPLSQNQNLGKANDNQDKKDTLNLDEADDDKKTPRPKTTTKINPVLDSKDNNVSKVFSNVLEQIIAKSTISSTKKQQNITITKTTEQVTETLDTPASSNNSSPANSPKDNQSISDNNEPKTPPTPETYDVNDNTQEPERTIIGQKPETLNVSPNLERLNNNSDINEIILQENTPTTTPGPKTPPTTPPTTPSPNSVAQIIGREATIVTTEITTEETPPTTPRPETNDQSNNVNDLNNNTTQAPQQETIDPSAKKDEIDDLIGKYYKSAGEKTAEYIKKNTSGFSSYNPETDQRTSDPRTYKDTSKTYGHLNPDDTTSLSEALKRRQAFLDRTKDNYKKTAERQSKNAIDHKGKIQQRQNAVTDAGKGFHEGVFEKHESYQKLEVQEQGTINIAGVELKTNGKQIDFPADLGKEHSNLSFIASFSFVDENGNNMKKKDAVYFGVSYKYGKVTDLMMPGGIKEETEGSNKGKAYIEIGEGENKKKYYAKASFETIKTLEEETTKNRAEAIEKAKLQELEEAKINAKYEEQFNKLSPDDQNLHNRFGSFIDREKLKNDVKNEMNESATKIQKVFRGHKVRKDLAEKAKQPHKPNEQDQDLTGGNNQTTTEKPPAVNLKQNTGTIIEEHTTITTPTGPQQTQTPPPPPPGQQPSNTTTPNQDPNLTGGNNKQQKKQPIIVPPLNLSNLNTNQNIQDNKTPPRTETEQTTQTPPNTPPETQPNTPPNGLGVDNTEPAAQPTNPVSSKVITVASKTQEQDKTNETEQNNEPKNSYLKTTLSSVISSSYSKSKDPITLEGLLNSDKIDTATKIALHRTFNTKTKYDNKLLKGAKEGKIKNMQEALNNGANVNAKSSKNANTALHRAVEGGNTEMVELLLAQEKIDVNIQNKQGNTALHCAVEENKTKMVELLLEKGARTDIKNNEEKTVHNILDKKFETLRNKDRKKSHLDPDYTPFAKISNLLTPYNNSEHSIGTTNRSRSNSWGFELDQNHPNSYQNNPFASMNNGKLNTSKKEFNDFEIVEPDENSSLASTPRSDSGFEIETPRSRSNTTDPIETTINALQTKQNPRSGVGNGQGRKVLAWGDDNSSVGSRNLSRNNSSNSLSNDENKEKNKENKKMKEISKSNNSLDGFDPDAFRNEAFNNNTSVYPPKTPLNKDKIKHLNRGNKDGQER